MSSGWEETAGREALLDCGIQYKRKGVVLSPLLVITIIIMEISQQAPEASPFISTLPSCFVSGTLDCGAPGGFEACHLQRQTGLGGKRGSHGERRPHVEVSWG